MSVDIMEDSIVQYGKSLMEILLQDKTTKKRIIWATSDYESHGQSYKEFCEITVDSVTGLNNILIQPRVLKAKEHQSNRTRDKAEVFTSAWVCNEQNNLIDESWFGRKNVFNTPTDSRWITNYEKIVFSDEKGKTWKDYVDARRMEVSCGEAPYLVSRYDAVSGEPIPVKDRIGLLDRRIRILCVEGRIPGAFKMGAYWSIPDDTEKPKDKRIKTGRYIKEKSDYEKQNNRLL